MKYVFATIKILVEVIASTTVEITYVFATIDLLKRKADLQQ